MADKRKTDVASRNWFRTGRFFKEDDKWYFITREGTQEGPYKDQREAEERLKDYIRIMNSGFMPGDSQLGLEPLPTDKE